jgi:hypothetical protein
VGLDVVGGSIYVSIRNMLISFLESIQELLWKSAGEKSYSE